ncbi:MAG TPA: HAD-IIIC family phosphatase [Vicinamibacterales bacterium]|nr:HAD-IIIC family phosphatase [Vicinamibacterales bacterium]
MTRQPIDVDGERPPQVEATIDWADRTLTILESRQTVFGRDTLDRMVERLGAIDRKTLRAWLDRRSKSPRAAYLQTQLLGGEPQALADNWDRVAAAATHDASLLLDAARASLTAGRVGAAQRHARAALHLRPTYTLLSRAAVLIESLSRSAVASHVRETRVALLGGSTTALLAPVLRSLCFRDRVDVDIYETVYGAYRQEVLDPQSGLFRFKPAISFVIASWRDLNLPPFVDDEDAVVERIVTECEQMWSALAAGCGCHVVQHGFDFPAVESHDYLAGGPRGRTRVLQRVNTELARRAPAGVSIVDQGSVQREVGLEKWQDDRLWHTARQHPSPEGLTALAELQMAHLRAVCGLVRKVVVCDLDNTLWGGIIGEDGLDGIRLGPDSPAGEAYRALQEYLHELRERGVLLAVCSKNNPADARLPFERHPHMRLKLDDIAVFMANWDDKVSNLRAIAQQLSLGLDSFVVLDDNAFERAWMRAQVPEATIVELGPTPASWTRDLDRGRYFFSLSLTDEDRKRNEQYRAMATTQALAASYASLDDFLQQLEMRAAVIPITAATLPRVVQLVGKTNQFNLTGCRHQRPDIEQLLAAPGAWGAAFSLADRLTDHGIVSTILCRPVDSTTWAIDTWVMSCRVLGRGLERFVMEAVLDAARTRGIETLVGLYRPTDRNALVSGLFDELGFTQLPSDDGSERRSVRCVDDERRLPRHHIVERAPAALQPTLHQA